MKRSNNYGITLIALVVTIVVLLILAGITIRLVFSNDGIISKAREAKNATEDSELADRQALNDLDDLIDDTLGGAPKADDDSPGSLDGDGSDQNPYRVSSIEDLVAFSQDVNSGNNYSGKNIILDVDLNFESDNSYINPNTTEFGDINGDGTISTIKQEVTTGNGFVPIGTIGSSPTDGNMFSGIFDGQNHSIENYNINVSHIPQVGALALFLSNNGTIKNLNINSMDISSTSSINDDVYITSLCFLNNGTIENCSVTGDISGTDTNIYFSSIAGNNYGTIKNCYNKANINFTTDKITIAASGICTNNYGKILMSANEGNINATFSDIYGSAIVPVAITYRTASFSGIANNNVGEINGCYNSGILSTNNAEQSIISGISANNYQGQTNGKIYNSYNLGNLSGDATLSNTIVSGISSSEKGIIQNCYNVGVTNVSCSFFSQMGISKGLSIGLSSNMSNCYTLNDVSEDDKYKQLPGVELGGITTLDSDAMKNESLIDSLNKSIDSEYNGEILFIKNANGYPTVSMN